MDKNKELTLKNLSGKYVKQALTRLEEQYKVSAEERKIIIDAINDFSREMLEILELDSNK